MLILKLGLAVSGLFVLHEVIARAGNLSAAHAITAGAAVLLAVIFGLTRESFI